MASAGLWLFAGIVGIAIGVVRIASLLARRKARHVLPTRI